VPEELLARSSATPVRSRDEWRGVFEPLNVEESAYRSPPLTTFDVRPHLLGREAVRKLVAVTQGDDLVTRTIVEGQLELRASTALPGHR
jgi:hypothetical protein